MRFSITLCLFLFVTCCLATKEILSDNTTYVYTNHQKYTLKDKILAKRQQKIITSLDTTSSSTAPISTDPILALVIFVTLSSILF
ncbi:hypothetical protein INT46_006685 [Mucor plumbeus]|uniref:Uncharacterized protein n=1 Tax=Mucor plumbeus TaxID=97098 RepID=A0A8H7UV29_9FUNG|nr:hypothetical protein INT46_006685 [Mucor plumbeus]